MIAAAEDQGEHDAMRNYNDEHAKPI